MKNPACHSSIISIDTPTGILFVDVMEFDIDAVYVCDSAINIHVNTLISMCYAAQK